jgi:hypothetical protein
MASTAIRDRRRTLRYRHLLVRQMVQMKNRISGLLIFCAASALMLYCGRLNSGRLLQLRVLRLAFLQDGDVGVGVLPEGGLLPAGGILYCCTLPSFVSARNLFWHSLAAANNCLNSGVPRSFSSSGSLCKAE